MAIGLLIVAFLVLFMQWLVLREVRRVVPRGTRPAPGKISSTINQAVARVMNDSTDNADLAASFPYRDRLTPDEFARYAEKRNLELHQETQHAKHI